MTLYFVFPFKIPALLGKAVVFVIDRFSEPVHIQRLVAGVKRPKSIKMLYSLLADLSNVIPGTSVFFYKRRINEPQSERGFVGEFVAISDPYECVEDIFTDTGIIYGKCPYCGVLYADKFDDQKNIVCDNCREPLRGHLLPLRVSLNVKRLYERYLDDNHAYIDITDKGRLNTLIFRKIYGPGRERGVAPILPEEAEKIRRLLQRMESSGANDEIKYTPQQKPFTCSNRTEFQVFIEQIFSNINKKSGEVLYEFMLEFYITYHLGRLHRDLKTNLDDIFRPISDIEWFGNQILFGIGGDKSDLLILYKDGKRRYRADVVELKKGAISEEDVGQAYKYLYWIGQLVTSNIYPNIEDVFRIRPIVVGKRLKRGFSFHPKVMKVDIPYPRKNIRVISDPPEVWSYVIDKSENTIYFERIF